MKTRTLYATLIGINEYPTPRSKLKGCIKDVLGIDLFLRELQAQQGVDDHNRALTAYKPLYLLAPTAIDRLTIGDYEAAQKIRIPFLAPSFANVSGPAFEHLKQAENGDICLFYYSGHGSWIQAPEAFRHSKPSGRNETIVCVDSRSGARDLIDKELAYLFWDALRDPVTGKEKDIHCVVIMDCCFAGNNIRGEEESEKAVLYRHDPPSTAGVPLEQYLGFDTAGIFYELQDGNADIKIARYVQLGAAQDTEMAAETSFDGGLFTAKLLESLRCGGAARSYRELIGSLRITVRNRAGRQNPVAFSRDDQDLDRQFLGPGIIPYKARFEVRFDALRAQWILYGGALQGLVASTPCARTLVRIDGSAREIALAEVFSDYSVLDAEAMQAFDPDREHYLAELLRLACPGLQIGISEDLCHIPERMAALRAACADSPPVFVDLNFDKIPALFPYLIRLTGDDQYVLTRRNETVPMFKRVKEPSVFLPDLDSMGKWIYTSTLKNERAGISKNDFIFTWEKIEGKPEHADLNAGHLDDHAVMYGDTIGDWPEELVFRYVNGKQPAFRLSIAIHPDSPLESCYVGALYLDGSFGISDDFIRRDANLLVRGQAPLHLQFSDKAHRKFYKTIPLRLDAGYKALHIKEISEFLKIFISDQPMDLQYFVQPGLELDGSTGAKRGAVSKSPGGQADWTVFTVKIRVVGPDA